MKWITLSALWLLLMSFTLTVSAQSSGIDRYYETYKQDDRFTQITVSSKMFSLFVNFEMDDPDEQQLVETISKLKGLKMLIGNEVPDAKSIYRAALKMPAANMEELMSIQDAEKEMKFFITESNGMISELMMVGYENQQVIMLSLVGKINLREIAALSQKMDIQGFEYLKNVNQK